MLAETLIGNTVTVLAEGLAIVLGLGSATFYLAAFFFPEVHRRLDAIWSGLGLFYAVVLWFCAGQVTGIVLLGQLTAVALLLGLGWQTLKVRREKTPVYQQTPIARTPEVVGGWAKSKINQLRIAPDDSVRPATLEKRSERLDPRRRPVYEYEFVEDGIGDVPADAALDAPLTEADFTPVDFQALEAEPAVEESAAPSEDYIAPPNAEAEILSAEPVNENERVRVEETVADDAAVETAGAAGAAVEPLQNLGAQEAIVRDGAIADEPSSRESDIATSAEDDVANEDANAGSVATPEDAENALNRDASQFDVSLREAAPTDPSPDVAMRSPNPTPDAAEPTSADSTDEWDDDWFDTDLSSATQSQSSPNQSQSSPSATQGRGREKSNVTATENSKERLGEKASGEKALGEQLLEKTPAKPSLLAIPGILIGWVKDVVVSMSKPKPAKPVIDIPRREAAPSSRQAVGATSVGATSVSVGATSQAEVTPQSPSSRNKPPGASATEPQRSMADTPAADAPLVDTPSVGRSPVASTPAPETNWPDDAADTNWDDEDDWPESNWGDTNWPETPVQPPSSPTRHRPPDQDRPMPTSMASQRPGATDPRLGQNSLNRQRPLDRAAAQPAPDQPALDPATSGSTTSGSTTSGQTAFGQAVPNRHAAGKPTVENTNKPAPSVPVKPSQVASDAEESNWEESNWDD